MMNIDQRWDKHLKYLELKVQYTCRTKVEKSAMYVSAKNSNLLVFLSSNNKYLGIRWKFM